MTAPSTPAQHHAIMALLVGRHGYLEREATALVLEVFKHPLEELDHDDAARVLRVLAADPITLSPLARLPAERATREVTDAWRSRLRDAGVIWWVRPREPGEEEHHPAPEVVQLVAPADWLTPEREAWLESHEGELRELVIGWTK
jgi:hypothetical protein